MPQTRSYEPPPREMLRDVFRESGVRLTNQREQIWDNFRRKRRGMSITEAVEAHEKRGIGLSTVYRTVALLEEHGLLRRIHDHAGEHRYIASRPGHFHPLVCRSCGVVVEFESCGMGPVERMLAAETGFAIEGHDLEVHGRCPKCQ